MYRKFLGMLAALAVIAGCTSVKTTYLHRNEDDTGWKTNHLKGVPITLDVPTHVRFNVIERYFLVNGQPLRYPTPINEAVVARDVKYDLITEKKIFTVDMKRPAAGPYQNNTTFDYQSIKSIDHRLDDQTIEQVGKQVNALVSTLTTGNLPTGFATATGDEPEAGVDPNISTVESIVCSAVFKLDAPDFEVQVAEFLRANCGPLPPVPVDPAAKQALEPVDPIGSPAGVIIGPPGTNAGVSGSIGRSGNTGPFTEPVPGQPAQPSVNTVPGVVKPDDPLKPGSPKPAAGQALLEPSRPAPLNSRESSAPVLARATPGRPVPVGSALVVSATRPSPTSSASVSR